MESSNTLLTGAERDAYIAARFPSSPVSEPAFPPVSDTITWFKNVDWAEQRQRARAGVNNIGLVLAVLGEKLHEAGVWLAEV